MQVIAQTSSSYLIEATKSELQEIINSVTGKKPENIDIGLKIPAIDYATTITKIKALKESYDFKELVREKDDFVNMFEKLQKAVENAASISI